MAEEILKRDVNRTTVVGGVSNDASLEVRNLRVDPSTNALIILGDITVTSSVLPTGAATLAEQQTQTASLSVLDDWDESDRAKVNLIVGQAGIAAGTGVDGVTVPRVSLATNVPLPAGTALLGKTGRDTNASGTPTSVASSASNQTLLASNASRKHVIIYNNSAQSLNIKYGATASSTSFTTRIPPFYEWEMSGAIYTGIIDGIWDAANGAALVTEL